jgi:bcr-type benzoyl-CoA reductase subunit C
VALAGRNTIQAVAFEQLMDLVKNPYRDWETHYPGRRAFGYLCTYAPLEVLHAAGFTPLRLMQLSGPVALANAHLPSFACAPARAVTERMLSGELDWITGVLFTHTCDTMQCLADIWRMAGPRFKVIPFSLPTVLSAPNVKSYVVAELQRLAALLEAEFGTAVTDDALRTSIRWYNEQRRLLSALHERRGCFAVEQLWALTMAGMLMPVEEHITLLQSSLLRTEGRPGTENGGPGLVLVGAILDDPIVPRLIEELGGRVVGDDLCTGSRYYDTLVDEAREPVVALAERHLKRVACPAKHNAANGRAHRLRSLVRTTGARGAIFVLPKFCDPHAFDYVPLAKALDQDGVPHLLIETDVTTATGQLRTRLQAFIEVLENAHG